MNKKVLLIFSLVLFPTLVCGDGFVLTYSEDGVERDVMLSSEDSQVALIDYHEGVEDMLISVRIKPQGKGMLWIFPIPADPETSEIDITTGFPEIEGYNIKNKIGCRIKDLEGWSLISQIWTIFPAYVNNEDFLLREFFSAEPREENIHYYGSMLFFDEPDYGVRVYHRMNKMGLTSELLTARYASGLEKYLAVKNLSMPKSVMDEISWYIGKEYAFVVSWVSDPEKFGQQKKDLALRIKFPTDQIYYPLKLTSAYGQQRIPITIYFRGHVTPRINDFIKESSDMSLLQAQASYGFRAVKFELDINDLVKEGYKIDYFISEDYSIPPELDTFFGGDERIGRLKYTRLIINTESHNLKDDLWVSSTPPLSVFFADLWSDMPNPLFELLLFASFSCLASLLAGLLVFKGEIKPTKLLILGLSNLTSLVGFALASHLMLRNRRGGKIPKRTIFFFIPLLLMVVIFLFGLMLSFLFGIVMFWVLYEILWVLSFLLMIYFLYTTSLIPFSFVKEKTKRNIPLHLATISPLLLVASPFLLIAFLFIINIINLMLPYEIGEVAMVLLLCSIYFSSIIYLIYLLYSSLRKNQLNSDRRIFYPTIMLNIIATSLIFLNFVKFIPKGGDYIIYSILLVDILIYLLPTTTLLYFTSAREKLDPHLQTFLYIILFSILFTLISFFSLEILMLEYHPL